MIKLDGEMLTILLVVICMLIIGMAIKLYSLKTENDRLHELSDSRRERMRNVNNIIDAQERLISLQEEIINEQNGEIRALEYMSRYPLITSNVPVKDRKAGR